MYGSVTRLNLAWQTATVSLQASCFPATIVAIPTVANPQALLYNGITLPTASGSKLNGGSSSLATSISLPGSSNRSIGSTRTSNPTASPNPGSSQAPSPKSANHAWIAGAAIGPLIVSLLIIAGSFYRQKRKIGTELETIRKMFGRSYQKTGAIFASHYNSERAPSLPRRHSRNIPVLRCLYIVAIDFHSSLVK